ncbi:unnamed protein product, partial [Discosporangium mesarthrocarpum]
AFAPVKEACLAADPNTGASLGVCFVEFDNVEHAQHTLVTVNNLGGTKIDGSPVTLSFAALEPPPLAQSHGGGGENKSSRSHLNLSTSNNGSSAGLCHARQGAPRLAAAATALAAEASASAAAASAAAALRAAEEAAATRAAALGRVGT